MTDNAKNRIYVVDDTEASLELLTDILSDEGYEVAAFTDGNVAVASAKDAPPDLILLDIMMPDATGYQVCEKFKEHETAKDAPVIFVSAKNDILDKVKAFSMGGVDYIPKPFQVDEVLARVKTHLKLRNLQQNLEKKNEELSKTLDDLKAAQNQLVRQEKMAALGQLIAGIAHEINTPLAAIRACSDNIASAMEFSVRRLPGLLDSLSPRQRENFGFLVGKALSTETHFCSKDARKWRRQISEKFESLGIESPETVADTIVSMGLQNEIRSFLPLLKSPGCAEIFETANSLRVQYDSCRNIKMAGDRAAKVVLALKSFVHFSADKKIAMGIKDGVETVLTLYRNQLKKGVRLSVDYGTNPAILCFPDELNQVWSNLVQNALYAMNGSGTLRIKVSETMESESEGWVLVQIVDSGPGVPDELKERIFEPFFTTKPMGEGSGLGLDIAKKIVDRHGGRIGLESEPGRTVFNVFLPKNNKANRTKT